MTRLLAMTVAVVAVIGVLAELVAPALVEARIERTVRAHTSGVGEVEADAGAFPFLPGLLLDGVVDHLEVTLRDVDGELLMISTVALRLEELELDRGRLLSGTIEVVDIDAGSVVVEVGEAELAEALGVPVDLDSRLVEVAGRALEVAAGDVGTRRIPVPDELLPCAPDLERVDAGVRLSCRFEDVPAVLARAVEG